MLQHRNPYSPTYGCFDRFFWHIRVSDFPVGRSHEFVWPLALARAHPFEDNPFHGNVTIRDRLISSIDHAARSAHADRSCDDDYPSEKASGAAAFSLLAIVRADPAPFAAFLLRRARWLGEHQESGRLSNHEALIANGLRGQGGRGRGGDRVGAELELHRDVAGPSPAAAPSPSSDPSLRCV
jgi:hypothetical protein